MGLMNCLIIQYLLSQSLKKMRHQLQTPLSQYPRDRKSTRLNSSHVSISYAVFCLKKKTIMANEQLKPTLRHLQRIGDGPKYVEEQSDADLLERYADLRQDPVIEGLHVRHRPIDLG